MKFYLSLLLIPGLLAITVMASAQTKKEKQVAARVEELRQAMIAGDSVQLVRLVSDRLSYGHSSGNVDDKIEFVQKLVSGRSDFVTMDLNGQSIVVEGRTAIVRHQLFAKTNDGGKQGEVNLKILLVWQKMGGNWKLVARQAVKI